MERASRKSILLAARKERKRIDKVVHAQALDKYLDQRQGSYSLQAETTFDVGTLARGRGPVHSDPCAVTFLEPPGQGGIIGSGSPEYRSKDGADMLIATRHAELFNEIDRMLQEPVGDRHQLALETEGEFHPYRGVGCPRTTQMARPISMDDIGDRLITPQERRNIHEFEKKTLMAKQLFRKAQADRARAMDALRHRYPNGVLGIDSPNNMDSSIYGDRARQLDRVRAKTAEAHKRRSDAISFHSDSRVRRGFDIISLKESQSAGQLQTVDEIELRNDVAPMFQSKRRVETAPGKNHNTHQRLFARDFIRPKGVRRNQANMRKFDIVTGVAVPEDKRRPSIEGVLALDIL